MIRPPLPSEVLSRFPTDKVGGPDRGNHSYGPFYDEHLSKRRWCGAVLEIGIGNGGSLRAFAEFFPEADIVGLDVVPGRLVNEGRIRSHLLDASDPHEMSKFAGAHTDHFDVIIDDGSHRLQDQLLSVLMLRRCLKRGGLFVVEDIDNADHKYLFEAYKMTVLDFAVGRRRDDRLAYYLMES